MVRGGAGARGGWLGPGQQEGLCKAPSLCSGRPGWRGAGFGMGGGHEAYDAELAALVYGLLHLLGRRETGRSYTIFTDSTAAMRRAVSAPRGPARRRPYTSSR